MKEEFTHPPQTYGQRDNGCSSSVKTPIFKRILNACPLSKLLANGTTAGSGLPEWAPRGMLVCVRSRNAIH
jgi:hypothetical protein